MIFLVVAFSIFLIISAISYFSIQRVNEQLEIVKKRAAQQEISHALVIIKQRLISRIGQITSWDEMLQQLDNPAYYPYMEGTSPAQQPESSRAPARC